MIYVVDILHEVSGDFGSGCNRSWVNSSFSAFSKVTFSSGIKEQRCNKICEWCFYEGLMGIINT
jgi:hypothetical protein